MTQQLDLFGGAVTAPAEYDGMMTRGPVRSAREGQITSMEAAERHEGTGKAAAHREQVLEGVRRLPGLTSRELAAEIGMDRHEAARRLPELESLFWVIKGEARKCRVGGTNAVTWWPTRRES